jgi:hypothetical protein
LRKTIGDQAVELYEALYNKDILHLVAIKWRETTVTTPNSSSRDSSTPQFFRQFYEGSEPRYEPSWQKRWGADWMVAQTSQQTLKKKTLSSSLEFWLTLTRPIRDTATLGFTEDLHN